MVFFVFAGGWFFFFNFSQKRTKEQIFEIPSRRRSGNYNKQNSWRSSEKQRGGGGARKTKPKQRPKNNKNLESTNSQQLWLGCWAWSTRPWADTNTANTFFFEGMGWGWKTGQNKNHEHYNINNNSTTNAVQATPVPSPQTKNSLKRRGSVCGGNYESMRTTTDGVFFKKKLGVFCGHRASPWEVDARDEPADFRGAAQQWDALRWYDHPVLFLFLFFFSICSFPIPCSQNNTCTTHNKHHK